MSGLPTKTGFYWARWMTAESGTPEGEVTCPDVEWEIVHVFEADDELRAMIPGVSSCQSIANFEWGDFVADERFQ